MQYLSFVGWLAFMSWMVADTVPRYVTPKLAILYDALEELAVGKMGAGRMGRPLSLAIQIIISLTLAYLLGSWSSWCVLRCLAYAPPPGGLRVAYFVTGFVCCEYPLAKMARADQYRGFFMSVFHFTLAMGAFIVFSMNPQPIKEAFPWLLSLMRMKL